MDTNQTMTSHPQLLEVGELTNLRWHRLQLVVLKLKKKGGDETSSMIVRWNADNINPMKAFDTLMILLLSSFLARRKEEREGQRT